MLNKLRSSLLFKFSSLLFAAFVALYLISYALMHNFLLGVIEPSEMAAFMSSFNDVWIAIFILYGLFYLGVFLIYRFWIARLTKEVEDINSYLEEINRKNYGAVLKIKHHLELLKLAVLLKNLVKRVKNKKS